ncbi:polysaccharide synthase [Podospora appendiculata]|uniref:Polysaccharide synthase n=1 Tax=Podospora appendiculata TaxID=314037 RepID=A0AAE1CAP4_9PEZI|nr:polysaccharide synthase [Podospora appendiculata]
MAQWYGCTLLAVTTCLGSEDVTGIIPTIHNRPEELRYSLESILACKPAKLILVTTCSKQWRQRCANKRLQISKALEDGHVKTDITVLADDDFEWPSTLMPWLLTPFEDDRMGGIGTCQRVKRVDGDLATRIFNWLGAAYIERRNEISATHNIDGGTLCMYILNADDDNFITRWLVAHRNRQPWCTYALHIATFTSLAFVVDALLLFSCWWGTGNWEPRNRRSLLGAEIAFMFGFSKVVKLVGLFRRNPSDIMFLPVSILFGYFHGLIKIYALCTLNKTSWGSREDGNNHNAFPKIHARKAKVPIPVTGDTGK